MSKPLPPKPHLDQYRKQAKDLLRAFRVGDSDALSRVRAFLPLRRRARPQSPAERAPAPEVRSQQKARAEPQLTLGDAQLVIAREHGFSSWRRFKQQVEAQIASPLLPAGAPSDPSRTPPAVTEDPWTALVGGVCLVPGLGIRPAGAPGLVAIGPTTVQRESITATVTRLFSGGGETDVRVEVAGLAPSPDGSAPDITIILSNSARGTAAPARRRSWRGQMAADGSVQACVEAVLPALPDGAREAKLLLGGPPPLNVLPVIVPVIPIREAGLRLGRRAGGRDNHHGISVRAAWVVSDAAADAGQAARDVAVQLVGEAAPPIAVVHGTGRTYPPVRLLRTAGGREFTEVPSPPSRSVLGRHQVDDVLFQEIPMDVDLEHATLIVPHVTVMEETPPARLWLPLEGWTVGKRVAVGEELALGSYSIRVLEAELMDPVPFGPGDPRLLLHVDLGGWQDGRKLIGPGRLTLEIPERRIRQTSTNELHGPESMTRIWVQLPKGELGRTSMTFSAPTVALAGPWTVPLRRAAPQEAAEAAVSAHSTARLPAPGDDYRRALLLAAEEAARLTHAYVGTEHLLLGLLRFQNCTAMHLLRRSIDDPDRIRRAVEQVLSQMTPTSSLEAIALGSVILPVPLTSRSHRVLGFAAAAAFHLGHPAIGTEHILLGLVEEHDGIAGAVLRSFGVTLEPLRAAVARLSAGGE